MPRALPMAGSAKVGAFRPDVRKCQLNPGRVERVRATADDMRDDRAVAAQGVAAKGMAEKSAEFMEKGGKLYVDAAE